LVVPTLNSASAVGTTTEQVTNQSPDILLATGTQISLRYPGILDAHSWFTPTSRISVTGRLAIASG
jgi:hypothetical protein